VLKKNPERKVPQHCRDYPSFKYIVWESSLMMAQSAVVRFLTVNKLSARDITAELKGLYGPESLSLSAVKKWRRQFVHGKIGLKDDPRSGKRPRSDLCESLQVLVDQTFFISCKCMCQKLRIAKTTCLRVLYEDLGFRKSYLRWIPHSMTENEALCRATFSQELFRSCVSCYFSQTLDQHLSAPLL
jgi:hypothetical protein